MPDDSTVGVEIRSEARGAHWIAWRANAGGKPEAAVVFVGETREEAEARAARWWKQKPG